ncbi:hypothetical protein BU23DRAFT_240841 [Bimuria novae-zelandiae CBS 107.79]|uniref:Uncharacterized protein n=1 Tax=Bimuria novae-zelandiae CBS 107.79 TaxID=1447943 RepID=A0A6A5UW53_9PLEO|nr:hypothetical protein BU23DRAFT_240841 [Bimuria novae-zelandiae CBS 107.79]
MAAAMGTCNPPFSLPTEFRFVHERPSEAKPASRRIPPKGMPYHGDKPLGITGIPRCDSFEDNRLACLDVGASAGAIGDSGDRADGHDRSGPADHDDNWTLFRERGVNYEQNGHARDVLSITNESPHEGSPTERGSQEITTGIGGHQGPLMADSGEERDCRVQGPDASAQNTMGDLVVMSNESEVIDLTDPGDESTDDEREGEDKCSSQGSRSSNLQQDARTSTQPASVESTSVSPSVSSIQADNTLPRDDPLVMMDTSIPSSEEPLLDSSIHAIQNCMVDAQQLRNFEQARDEGHFEPSLSSWSNDDIKSDDDEHNDCSHD